LVIELNANYEAMVQVPAFLPLICDWVGFGCGSTSILKLELVGPAFVDAALA